MKKPSKLKSVSLNRFASDTYSQFGEDGILAKIFKVLKVRDPWCVEFGAWDGIAFSNTRLLIEQGWSAVLIEPNPRKFVELTSNNADFPKVHLLQTFVMLKGALSLDSQLTKLHVPKNFDLLSIDIDGNDFHVWKSVTKYKPKVVLIEFNNTIPPEVSFVQPSDFSVNQGSSLLALQELAKSKGYELTCCTESNGIFVERKLFSKFGITNNQISDLWEYKAEVKLFQLFDGTIKLTKPENTLLWSGIRFTEDDIQVIPKVFRTFPEGYVNMALVWFFKTWRKLIKGK